MNNLFKQSFMMTALLVSGCGQVVSSEDSLLLREEVSITHNVTIDGVKQEISETFLTHPRRVATFNFGVLDMFDYFGLESLGIQALGLAQASTPLSLEAYNDDQYYNIGTLFEPDYTALDFFNPDLIILDGRSATLYEGMKERYPQADVLDATLTTYRLQTQQVVANNIATLFPSVATAIESVMTDISEDIERVRIVAENHEALFVLSNGDALTAYGDTGRYQALYADFGFMPAVEGIETSGQHGTSINKEYLTSHDPEIIFILDRAAAIGETSGLESFLADPLVKTLSAYQNQHIYALDAQAWYVVSGGFTSTRQMIEDVDQFTQVIAE